MEKSRLFRGVGRGENQLKAFAPSVPPSSLLPPPLVLKSHLNLSERVATVQSDGQSELLALQYLRIVYPEEIRVQHGLDQAGDPRNLIDIAFGKVAVQPVRNVQGPVQPQRKQVVRGDGFGFAGALQHEELGQDGDGFEPDAEGPKHLFSRRSAHCVCLFGKLNPRSRGGFR